MMISYENSLISFKKIIKKNILNFMHIASVIIILESAISYGVVHAQVIPQVVHDPANFAETQAIFFQNLEIVRENQKQTFTQSEQKDIQKKQLKEMEKNSKRLERSSLNREQLNSQVNGIKAIANDQTTNQEKYLFKDLPEYRDILKQSVGRGEKNKNSSFHKDQDEKSRLQKKVNQKALNRLNEQKEVLHQDAQQVGKFYEDTAIVEGQVAAIQQGNELMIKMNAQLLAMREAFIKQQEADVTRKSAVADMEARVSAEDEALRVTSFKRSEARTWNVR